MNDTTKNTTVEDFGEYIGGAKKHNFASLDLSSVDTRKLPLSKLWATSEIDAIEDKTTAAIAHYLRHSLPNKPHNPAALKRWFQKLENAQTSVRFLESNPQATKDFLAKLANGVWVDRESAFQIKLMLETDRKHWKEIKSAIYTEAFIVRVGDESFRFNANGMTTEVERAVENLKDQVLKKLADIDQSKETSASPKSKKFIQFEIYQNPITQEVYAAAAPDKIKKPLKYFDSVAEARDFIRNPDDDIRLQNIAELNQLWNEHKERNNILKSDMRNSTNAERTGTNYRMGRDISPEEFMATFGIRGGQFGNWVKGDERQAHINLAYDAFMDLSKAANIPPIAIGLDGSLGIAFGARGSGWAAAHYEPAQKVINLTKTRGAGSLAHEWWHALDHYLGNQDLATRDYMTIKPDNMRHAELSEPLKQILEATRTTGLATRSQQADGNRNKPYFSTNVEMTARAFEGYIRHQLEKQGVSNDYLVNITSLEYWKRNPDAYVYPTPDEIAEFSKAYNTIFDQLSEVDKSFERQAQAEVTLVTAEAEQTEQPAPASEFGQDQGINAAEAVKQTEAALSQEITAQHPVLIPESEKGSTLGNSKHDQFLKDFADRLLEKVQNNQAPWQEPFNAGDSSNRLPISGATGKRYSGVNMVKLMMEAADKGYTDNRWFTYQNAQELGGQVRRGEKGTSIMVWNFPNVEQERAKAAAEGREFNENNLRPFARSYTVFNAEQIDNIPEKNLNIEEKLLTEFERHERAENILTNSGVKIHHTPEKTGYYSAHYTPANDTITLPQKELFRSESDYYVTALHELAHATGHESRLNRDLSGAFGSYSYAKEELRAEMASMIIGEELQIGHDPSNHHAYLQNWAAIIQNDPKEFFEAMKDADKISAYIMEYDRMPKQKVKEAEAQQEIDVSQDKQPVAQSLPSVENTSLTDKVLSVGHNYELKDRIEAVDPKILENYIHSIKNAMDYSDKHRQQLLNNVIYSDKTFDARNYDFGKGMGVTENYDQLEKFAEQGLLKKLDDGWKYEFTEIGEYLVKRTNIVLEQEEREKIEKERIESFLNIANAMKAQIDQAPTKDLAAFAQVVYEDVQNIHENAKNGIAPSLENLEIAQRHLDGLNYSFERSGRVYQFGGLVQNTKISIYCEIERKDWHNIGDVDLTYSDFYDKDTYVYSVEVNDKIFHISNQDVEMDNYDVIKKELGYNVPNLDNNIRSATNKKDIEINAPSDFEKELQSIQLPKGVNYRYERLDENVEIARLYVGEWSDDKITEQAFIDKNSRHIGYVTNYNGETNIYNNLETAARLLGNRLAKDYAEEIAKIKDQKVEVVPPTSPTDPSIDSANKNPSLNIALKDFSHDSASQEVQQRAVELATNHTQELLSTYKMMRDTFGGRYIASDMMKEVFDDFSKSPANRNQFNNAVHNSAASLAAEQFKQALDAPLEGRNTVVFLTGCPGAGKTSSVMNNGGLKENTSIVFEGQLANANTNPATLEKIQMALDKGYDVEVIAVNPLPEQALENTFRRYYDPNDGRGAPISTMARIQGNTYEGLEAIHNKFGDAVGLTIVDKPNGNHDTIIYSGWDHLDVLKSQGTEAEISSRLTTHLLQHYKNGNIDYECFKQSAGSEQQAKQLLGASMDATSSRSPQTHGDGRSVSSGSVVQSDRGHDSSRETSSTSQEPTKSLNTNTASENRRLYVPFEQKDAASALGARWDKENKHWYAPAGSDLERFKPWLNEPQKEAYIPEHEFAKFLEDNGVRLPQGHPIMDGRFHRVPIHDDHGNKTSAAYIGHTDGVARGSLQDFKTGTTVNWTAKEKTVMPSSLDIEQAKRQAEAKQMATYNETAVAAQKILSQAPPTANHPYLDKKGVAGHGVMVVPDKNAVNLENTKFAIANDWREASAMREQFKAQGIEKQVLTKGDLIVPAVNETGEVRTFQTISGGSQSFKSFLKDGEKSGSFHALGDIENGKDVLIAEGYVTAASLHEETGKTVIVAFDAGNLTPVAEKVRALAPQSNIYIAADNDHTKANNAGINAANKAAEKVGAVVIAPNFDAEDKGTDWNDLQQSNRDVFRMQLQTSEMGRRDFENKLANLPPEKQEVFKGWYDYVNEKLSHLPETRNNKQASLEQEILKAEQGLSNLPSVAEYQAAQAAKKQQQQVQQVQTVSVTPQIPQPQNIDAGKGKGGSDWDK